MSRRDRDGINPGEELKEFLEKLYPLKTTGESGFLADINNSLITIENNEFTELVYNSVINYLIRRLINTTEYVRNKYKNGGILDDKIFTQELKRTLKNIIKIHSSQLFEELVLILKACSIEINGSLGDGAKDRIRRQAKSGTTPLGCYICGDVIDFTSQNPKKAPEVEHIWPNKMGGLNADTNLKIAHHDCNQTKKTYIDGSDFHYEFFSIKTDKGDSSFWKEFTNEFRLAILAKDNFRCTNCGKVATKTGKLDFIRKEKEDIWHFLNIQAVCQDCLQKLGIED